MSNKKRAELVGNIVMTIGSDDKNKYVVIENELVSTAFGEALSGPRSISFAYTEQQVRDLIEHLNKGLMDLVTKK